MDDQQLLKIFLAEDGNVGAHQFEQLIDHGTDAVEMTRPVFTAQPVTQPGDVDRGVRLAAMRVDVRLARSEHHIGTDLFQH